MSARDDILGAVRAARIDTFGGVEPPPLPTVALRFAQRIVSRDDLVGRFMNSAAGAAARVVHGTRAELATLVAGFSGDGLASDGVARVDREAQRVASRCLSMVPGVPGTVAVPDDPHELADLDLLVCEGVLGVAENGGIWLPASRLGERSALVLARHVVVVLARSSIVADLHAAYAALDVSAESFGVFLAGPSKTADIEQSLVIGAHGAMGVTVVLLDE